MKFFELRLKIWDKKQFLKKPPIGYRTYPRANGKTLNCIDLFNKRIIYLNNYISNKVLLDYFFLSDNNGAKDDWALLDAYNMETIRDAYIRVKGFLASKKLKEILDSFTISEPYIFYPSKLLYQNKKLDYFLFQMARENMKGFNYNKSRIFEIDLIDSHYKKQLILPQDKKSFISIAHITSINSKLGRNGDKNKRLLLEAHMDVYSDIFYFPSSGIAVSESLKNRLEKEEISGIEFRDLNFVKFSFG